MTEPLNAPPAGDGEPDGAPDRAVVRARRPFLARRAKGGSPGTRGTKRQTASGQDRNGSDRNDADPSGPDQSSGPVLLSGADVTSADAGGTPGGPTGTGDDARQSAGGTERPADPGAHSTGTTGTTGRDSTDPVGTGTTILSTGSESSGAEPSDTSQAEGAQADAPRRLTPADVLRGWQADLASSGLQNTLLHANETATTWLDLTHAHPSGLAQLMAGRPTRLSSLVREPAAHASARRRARAIRGKAAETVAERGVRSGYLAAGLATWRPGPLRVLDLDAGKGAVQAPVLLRACTLRPRGSAHEDYDVDLDDDVIVNPELLRRLGSEHAVRPDGGWLAGLAFGQSGFDPRPVFDLLLELCEGVPGFTIERCLLLGTFTAGSGALIADVDDVAAVVETHPVLAAHVERLCAASDLPPEDPAAAEARTAGGLLVDDGPIETRIPDGAPVAVTAVGPRSVKLDPRHENLRIFDLDPAQERALDAVRAGGSVAIEGPPGTGVTHTLAASAAAMVAEGRRVLVVTARRSTADAFCARLAGAGLPDLVLDLQDGVGRRRALLGTLGGAVGDVCSGRTAAAAAAPPEFTAHLLETLRTSADTLGQANEALHAVRQPWGTSAYQAMVELSGLMARPDPPTTRVRLPLPVLTRLGAAERERLRVRLHDAAAVGAFTVSTADTPWADADLRTDAAAEGAIEAVDQAIEHLQRAEKLMGEMARTLSLARAVRVRSWRPQLDLLVAVRTTLDRLLPAVYEQPLTGYIAVLDPAAGIGTGPAGQQHENRDQPDLGGRLSRMSLKRRARSLVRPGVHVTDLRSALVAAAEERRRWNEISEGGGWPSVPPGLAEAETAVAALEHAIDVLDAAFRRKPGGGEPPAEWREGLAAMPLPDLRRTLRELQKDPAGARRQPARAAILDELDEAGLGELVADLRRRHARLGEGGTCSVDGELDLAWWASVLEAIIRSDARLARHDGDLLRRASADYRLADAAALRDGARRLRARLAERAKRAAERFPEQAAWLQQQELASSVQAPSGDWPRDLLVQAGDVVSALRPIWIMSPDAVARLIDPIGSGIDVVIADDAGQVPTAEAVAALSRGRQIVLGGDRRRVPPQRRLASVLDDLGPVLEVRRLDRDHRMREGRIPAPVVACYPEGWSLTPGTGVGRSLTADLVSGGMAVPAPGEQLPISPDAEVQRVVELIVEHTRVHPDESLMVLTVGERHAQRIEEALRVELPEYPDAGDWLRRTWTSGGGEPFVVRPVPQALGLERDAVIVTIGIGRTPHGRVLHRFGELDTGAGAGTLISALTRARLRTTLVSCFSSADLDPERLKTDGGRLLRGILAAAEDPHAGRSGRHAAGVPSSASTGAETASTGPGVPRGPDSLVADLRDRLLAAGVPVEGDAQVIPVAEGWPVDLVVGDPRVPGRNLVAIDLDGPSYAAQSSLRDRERLRRERFERAGWTYCKIAVMDVFLDPQAEVRRIVEAWHAALGDPDGDPDVRHGAPAGSPDGHRAGDAGSGASAKVGSDWVHTPMTVPVR